MNISALSLLGVIFVTLKLCGVITWSWLWVTAPFWGTLAIFLAVMIAGAMAAVILGLLSAFKK